MRGAYIERAGLGGQDGLRVLRNIWSTHRVDEVFDQAGDVLLDFRPSKGRDVALINRLHASSLLFPPLWWLSTPRITTTWRYRVYDPNDYDVVAEGWGKTWYSHAYTLGLTEKGFHALYESEGRENFLGSTTNIRGHADLMNMVEKNLQMGREKRLKEWGV